MSRKVQQSPRAREKLFRSCCVSVPRTDTGVQAEKAKTCEINHPKGIRQNSPVTLVEGVPAIVPCGAIAGLRY